MPVSHPPRHPSIDPTRPSPTGSFAVRVVRAGGTETRIGPIDDLALADRIQDFLARQTHSTRPDAYGCTATVYPYDWQHQHLPLVPTEPGELREVLDDPEQGIGGLFPDVWDRMCAQLPYPDARNAFDQAMDMPRSSTGGLAARPGVHAAPGRKAGGTASIELTLADGTKARWTMPSTDPRLDQVERLLGSPDTLIP
ncbi:hypothetical protein ACIQU4_28655 [Streptomyces sp. NPDC090741]|uniref:hypothetical protein n=1 Tax=Streptomyces sp. NPDC090741 TaxID=3365967 RepID=UPI0037F1DCCF